MLMSKQSNWCYKNIRLFVRSKLTKISSLSIVIFSINIYEDIKVDLESKDIFKAIIQQRTLNNILISFLSIKS